MRNQKTLSLSIKVREAERKRQDSERLARENAWRERAQSAAAQIAGGPEGRSGGRHTAG